MRISRRVGAACAAAALTILSATSASADIIYNTLDATIDSTYETMDLTLPGNPGTTTLAVQIEGLPGGKPEEHPGCDLNGSGHYVTLVPHTSVDGVASVDLANGGVIDTCDDLLLVTVTPLAVGSTVVTFTGDERTNNDPNLAIKYDQAAFTVNVTPGGDTGGGSECDADPAAPAWATALLMGNGYKPKAKDFSNAVSAVAQHMGTGATFDGWAKNQPQYPYAVKTFLEGFLKKSLVKGPADVARPGWECVAIAPLVVATPTS